MPRLRLLAAFALLAVPVLAQEVKILGPVWAGPRPAPDSLPPPKGFDIDYPADARKGREIGYVLVLESVAANGKGVGRQVIGNYAVFEREVETNADWHIAPAARAGGAVDSDYRIMVIFNPASAAANRPDSTPRLLSTTPGPIPLTSARFPPNAPRQVVDAMLHLDEQGRVADIELPPDLAEFKEEVMHQLHVWHFAPARQGGQPVPATLALPLIVQPRSPPRKAKASAAPAHLPVPLHQTVPEYPPEMQWSGLTGQVVIGFVVDKTGSVQDAGVVRSNNPGFEDAALAAVRKWKFKPATLADGTPVPMRMEVPVIFQLDQFDEGRGIMFFSKLFSKLPPEMNYDVAPKPTSIVFPVYPYGLLRDGAGGDATVGYLITSRGKIAHTAVVKASRPEFGEALAAALAASEFDPAMRSGAPTATVVHQHYDFGVRATWIGSYSPQGESELLRRLEKHPEAAVPAGKLDQALRPTFQRAPVFPPNLQGRGIEGQALLEIVIDEEGKVRLPRVVSASQPEFGYAAAQAVIAWRFAPPRAAGQPVLTRIQVPFIFR